MNKKQKRGRRRRWSQCIRSINNARKAAAPWLGVLRQLRCLRSASILGIAALSGVPIKVFQAYLDLNGFVLLESIGPFETWVREDELAFWSGHDRFACALCANARIHDREHPNRVRLHPDDVTTAVKEIGYATSRKKGPVIADLLETALQMGINVRI
jgi:hypothetical protein